MLEDIFGMLVWSVCEQGHQSGVHFHHRLSMSAVLESNSKKLTARIRAGGRCWGKSLGHSCGWSVCE